jgi:two-component system cell cycle response regulator DivK
MYFDHQIKNGKDGMKKTILLFSENLDDNAILVRKVLSARGYEVLWANTFEKALDMVAVYPPSLILLDAETPDIDGNYPVRFFRNIPKLKKVPLIGMTASSEEMSEILEKDDGCDEYIQKPVDIQYLSETISLFLEPIS